MQSNFILILSFILGIIVTFFNIFSFLNVLIISLVLFGIYKLTNLNLKSFKRSH